MVATKRPMTFFWLHAFLCCPLVCPVLAHVPAVRRQAPSPTVAPEFEITAVTACHMHGATPFCRAGSAEYEVVTSNAPTTGFPTALAGCSKDGSNTFCLSPQSERVQIRAAAPEAEPTTSVRSSSAAAAAGGAITAVSACHNHGATQYCMVGTAEYVVSATATNGPLPTAYSGCHSHGSELYCNNPNGGEVRVLGANAAGSSSASGGATEKAPEGKIDCHSHAGVEHCVDENGNTIEASCDRVDRDYNIRLRVGLLFVILVTSAIGVFGPIILTRFPRVSLDGTIFVTLKQFGTGVIISTAFVHLYTHASLMFDNKCLGELKYEATASSIVMAGIFISFLIELFGQKIVAWKLSKQQKNGGGNPLSGPDPSVNLLVLEAGIIFHSILIGLTLVVAADSFFLTLFAVILFHQMFEGLALGTRIAALCGRDVKPIAHSHGQPHPTEAVETTSNDSSTTVLETKRQPMSMAKACLLAGIFALITPIGMAIGIGILSHFNGNDPSTIIAIGVLDAFSAGILIWVGIFEMLGHDWIGPKSEMASAGPVKSALGLFALVCGMVLMSVLGKWA